MMQHLFKRVRTSGLSQIQIVALTVALTFASIIGMIVVVIASLLTYPWIFPQRMTSGLRLSRESGYVFFVSPDGTTSGPEHLQINGPAAASGAWPEFIEITEYKKIVHTRVLHPPPGNFVEDQFFWPDGSFAGREVDESFLTKDQFVKKWY
jgi:hypothetical protein